MARWKIFVLQLFLKRFRNAHQPPKQKGTFTVKIAYWPPLILLIIGGAFYVNEKIIQEQPSKILPTPTPTPTPTSSQPEVPAKDKTETAGYKLF